MNFNYKFGKLTKINTMPIRVSYIMNITDNIIHNYILYDNDYNFCDPITTVVKELKNGIWEIISIIKGIPKDSSIPKTRKEALTYLFNLSRQEGNKCLEEISFIW